MGGGNNRWKFVVPGDSVDHEFFAFTHAGHGEHLITGRFQDGVLDLDTNSDMVEATARSGSINKNQRFVLEDASKDFAHFRSRHPGHRLAGAEMMEVLNRAQ